MDRVLDQLVGALEQLRGHDHDRGGAVAHLLVLNLGQLHKHTRRRVLHLEVGQDGGAIVGDGDLAEVIHEHLVQTDRAE